MLSADVSTCVDPNYDEVSDIQNGNILGCGIALEKYTGSGGKYNSSDANAEFVSQIMSLFEKNNVDFQMGTLGKIGKGGCFRKECYLSDCTGNRIYCGRSGDHGMRYGGKCQKRRCPWRGEGGWNHGREKNI